MKLWMAVLLPTLVPGVLGAQTVRSWPGLDPSALPTIYVVDETGMETAGRLLGFDVDALVLLVDGTERRFEPARVRRIERRGDSLRNGALIGAIVGAVLGGFSAGLADCPGSDPGGNCPLERAAFVLLSTAIYGGFGTAVDALVSGRTTLFVAPTSPPSTARARDPAPRNRLRAGLNLSFAW
jgi:hypothetical protein